MDISGKNAQVWRALGLRVLLVMCTTLVIYTPGLRALVKYGPMHTAWVGLTVVVVSIALISLVLLHPRFAVLCRLMARPWPTIILLMLMVGIVTIGYPIADGFKSQMRGSDQDDCIIMGGQKLLRGAHPYVEKTYFGNACSPGLGLLILYLPFVAAKCYELGALVSIVLVALCLWKCQGQPEAGALFIVVMGSNIFFWELAVVGSDLILLGSGLALLVLLLQNVVACRRWVPLTALAILCGLLASSRVNFLVLAPLISLFILAQWPRAALVFLAVSVLVALGPSVMLYAANPDNFTPLHLLIKSQVLLSFYREIVALLSSVVALAAASRLRRHWPLLPWCLFVSFLPSLAALALADFLVLRGGDLALWEGATYLMPLVPLACVLLVSLRRPLLSP